ncbi:MAG: 2Fe-2S iron-sulfur cluster binding domain-containing protein [Alphaproteobacteria bacterium]|nr:2Fe-2S iron-sulfur cluster binding domain-containing protein [Alphaproteobacteria bacterium]
MHARRGATVSKNHTVAIDQTGETFTVAPNVYVLDAALESDISYPRYCKTGVCGSCKSILVVGDIEHDSHTQVALSDDERNLGRFLACRARPKTDCTVAFIPRDVVPRFNNKIREVDCRVIAVERATHDVSIIRMEAETKRPFIFTAGQYASVALGDLPARDFSMASRPGERWLEFHIRGQQGSDIATYLKNDLQIGAKARIKGPSGTAYFREYHGTDILAVAGGTGIAPIKSIVDMALTAGVRQPIEVYFGVRAERDVYLADHFSSLATKYSNLKFTLVLSDEKKVKKGRRTGFVSDALDADLETGRNVRAYVAGPQAMVEATFKVLDRAGVRRKNCFADYFEMRRAAASSRL